MRVQLTINGETHEADVEPRLLLVHLIRAAKSCTMFAVQANGKRLMTVEGLEQDGKLHPLQEGFMAEHGLQCGYCTPGMLMTSYAFLTKHPSPSEEQIRWGISGNLCRCTGYVN